MFYAYNYPFQFSFNTGFETPDSEHLFFVVDSEASGFFVIGHDKPGHGGGSVQIRVDSPDLVASNVHVLVRDDNAAVSSDHTV